MRKVVAGLFMTLDGVVGSPGSWQEYFDEDMGEAMMEQLASQDAVLLGRVTYQEWAPYWPTATDESFASFINSTPKYVFSTTLDSVAAWQNSTLIKGDLAQAIAQLKQLPGKNIGTCAGYLRHPFPKSRMLLLIYSYFSELWHSPRKGVNSGLQLALAHFA